MWSILEQFAHDVRYALRTMAANPVFAVMAALSLALGIGANTAIFSFMESILLRSLPVPHPETLVLFDWHSKDYPAVAHSFNGDNWLDPKGGMISGNFPYPAYEALRANNMAFSSVFAFNQAGRLTLQIRDEADLANGLYVAGGFFGGIGLPPTAGRLIDDRDDRPEGCSVAVISNRYARSHFGEIDKIPGQTVLINNVQFLVIGVAAAEFYGVDHGDTVDVYLPMRANDLLQPRSGNPNQTKYLDNNFYWVQFMGRLRPGISLAQAQAALAPAFQRWIDATAKSDKERADLPALLLHEGAGGLEILRNEYAKPLYVLMTLVGLILAIACANVANLLLARAAARRREIAVRLSIGASRPRIIRQLLTESVLLACLGGALGLIFARWGIRLLTILIANGQDNFTLRAELNWHVLGATIALSLATGLFFGLVPALQATNVDLTTALKQTRAGASGMSLGRTFLRISLSRVLVVSQITISVLLLVAAGLFVRTLANLHSIELGFNRDNLLMFSINARQAGYEKERLAQFYEDLHARVAAIPGARRVTESNYALVSQSMWRTSIEIPGAVQSKLPGTASRSERALRQELPWRRKSPGAAFQAGPGKERNRHGNHRSRQKRSVQLAETGHP
jgi:predicted permease